jgi:hypothetical protein
VDEATTVVDLKNSIEKVVNQKYNVFEIIIVVDSRSESHKSYLLELEKKHSNIKYLSFDSSKSLFIDQDKITRLIGIKAAKYDWTLITNSRCEVNSEYWIKNMVGVIGKNSKIVIGAYTLDGKKYSKIQKMINLSFVAKNICFSSIGHPLLEPYNNVLVNKKFYTENALTANNHGTIPESLYFNSFAKKQNSHIVLSNYAVVKEYNDRYSNWKEKQDSISQSFKGTRRSTKRMLKLERVNIILFIILTILNLSLSPFRIYSIYILSLFVIISISFNIKSQHLLIKKSNLLNTVILVLFDLLMGIYVLFSRLIYIQPKKRKKYLFQNS